jgi:oligopeptide transport system ATP-binding protein
VTHDSPADACSAQPLLRVIDLQVNFRERIALQGVTFDLFAGETLGLVGESGSGKSTLARAILRLVRAERGYIGWRGQNLLSCDAATLRRVRRDLQIVFQDPLASLDPRMTIGETVAEPLRIFAAHLTAAQRTARVAAILERVGLRADMSRRYPHEFSGGQCQRVGIARAMILKPKLLICDEPVSSLDVSIQGQIVNLLLDLQRDAGTALLFISHNLAIVRHVSRRIMVMFAGRLVESAPVDALFGNAAHPYTQALLASVPSLAPAPPFTGVPSPTDAGSWAASSGCAFRARCSHAIPICQTRVPALEQERPAHWVACHRAGEWIS